MILVRADEVASRPWPNGGGRTRELVAGPRGRHWRWRISLAELDADGPLSTLPGVQRWLALVEGDPVELDFGSRVLRLAAGAPPIAFDGSEPPVCRVHGGRARALNLMLREVDGRLLHDAAGCDTPLRGFYDPAARELHWELRDAAAPAAAGVWIAVDPGDERRR